MRVEASLAPKRAAAESLQSGEQIEGGDYVRAWWQSALLALFACFIVVTGYQCGVTARMDGRLSAPLDSRARELAAAISDYPYDLGLRDAIHASVLATLTDGGMTDAPGGSRVPTAHAQGDANAWNDLLDKATHLPALTPTPSVDAGTLTFLSPKSMGIVDFDKLSFAFFGYNVQGLYKTYFVLLALGAMFCFAGLGSRPELLLPPIFLLIGITISILRLGPDDSVTDPRFMSTAAILPAYHLTALLRFSWRQSFFGMGSAAMQAALLAFITTINASAVWGMLLPGMIIIASLSRLTIRCWSTTPLKIYLQRVLTWPILVVVVPFAAVDLYAGAHINPVYTTLDELAPAPLFWHQLAYGLSFGSGLDAVEPALGDKTSDAVPAALVNVYLDRTIGFVVPDSYYTSDFFSGFKNVTSYERGVEQAYLDFAMHNPAFVIRDDFIDKPKFLWRGFWQPWGHLFTQQSGYLATVVLAGLLAAITAAPNAERRRDLVRGAKLCAAIGVISALPAMITYPSPRSDDIYAVWSGFLLALVVILCERGYPRVFKGWSS
jgi:hypothetical protein